MSRLTGSDRSPLYQQTHTPVRTDVSRTLPPLRTPPLEHLPSQADECKTSAYDLLENLIRVIRDGVGVVPFVLGWPVPVCPNRFLDIHPNTNRVWCTAGVRPRPHSLSAVHRRSHSIDPGSRSPPHLYADDTQVYGSCRPSASLELLNTITNCVNDVASLIGRVLTDFS